MLYSFLRLFFFNDTATTEIYTLSLHDALPIYEAIRQWRDRGGNDARQYALGREFSMLSERAKKVLIACCEGNGDRKSTRLNSSHANISYAVFCLKKKKNNIYMNK